MEPVSKGTDDLVILVIALAALVGVLVFAFFTQSEGQEPIPLPTSPTTAVTVDESRVRA